MTQTLAEMRSHVGQRVTITLDYDDPKGRVTGRLRHVTDDGEVSYVADDGQTYYGWPCLEVTPSGARSTCGVHSPVYPCAPT